MVVEDTLLVVLRAKNVPQKNSSAMLVFRNHHLITKTNPDNYYQFHVRTTLVEDLAKRTSL